MENVLVEKLLAGARGSVLDVPVGTGRHLALYGRLGLRCVGVDSSEDMLALARQKIKVGQRIKLEIGDACSLRFADMSFETVVCVRLFHLIEPMIACVVAQQICRVARKRIILTVQLGEKYSETKSDVVTHSERWFYTVFEELGWRVFEDHQITAAGWHVMELGRVE